MSTEIESVPGKSQGTDREHQNMDPLTHLIVSRIAAGKERSVLIAGLAPDLPFYAIYPPWLIATRQLSVAIQHNTWPEPPHWMYVPHHIAHSLPVLAIVGLILRLRSGQWPRWVAAWLLHILLDIPTHSRRYWALQFLWPFSSLTIDGISWPSALLELLQRQSRNSTYAS